MWMPVVWISASPRALLMRRRRRVSPVGALGTRHATILGTMRTRRPVLQKRVQSGGARWTSWTTLWRVLPLWRRRVASPVRGVRRVRARRVGRPRGSPVRVRRPRHCAVLCNGGIVNAVGLLRPLGRGGAGVGRLALLPLHRRRGVGVGLSRGRHCELAPVSAQKRSELHGNTAVSSWSLLRLKRATIRPHFRLCQTLRTSPPLLLLLLLSRFGCFFSFFLIFFFSFPFLTGFS